MVNGRKMTIRRFEHDAFVFQARGERVAVDFGSHSPKETVARIGTVQGVLISHEHPDHFNQDHVAALAGSSGLVVASAEVLNQLDGYPISRAAVARVGEAVTVGPFLVEPVPADHGPNVPMKPGTNLGFVVCEPSGPAVYFAGDLGATPAGLKLPPLSAILVPVDDGQYVFTPAQAADFVVATGHSGLVIPMHYPTGDRGRAMVDEFRARLGGVATVKVLDPGEALEVTA
jgi:L-ascorbate metabolism protein UlaG (beta-lactamase superfamily)